MSFQTQPRAKTRSVLSISLAALAAAALVVAGCGSSKSKTSESTAAPAAPATTSTTSSSAAAPAGGGNTKLALAANPSGFPQLARKLIALEQQPMAWENDVKALKVPVLIIAGDADGVTLEHIVKMFRLLDSRRVALPAARRPSKDSVRSAINRRSAGTVETMRIVATGSTAPSARHSLMTLWPPCRS